MKRKDVHEMRMLRQYQKKHDRLPDLYIKEMFKLMDNEMDAEKSAEYRHAVCVYAFSGGSKKLIDLPKRKGYYLLHI